MEAKKSHDLPPGSWRTRKVSSIIQSKSEELRTKNPDVRGKEMKSQFRWRANSPLLPHFSFCSVDLMMPTCTSENAVLYSTYQFKC